MTEKEHNAFPNGRWSVYEPLGQPQTGCRHDLVINGECHMCGLKVPTFTATPASEPKETVCPANP